MLDVSETYKIIIVVLRVISCRTLEGGRGEGVWGVTRLSQKRCHLSWLTNSVLAYEPTEPKCGGERYKVEWGRGAGGGGVSAIGYSCAHGVQINFGDLTPYLRNGCHRESFDT
jgi:hypothetical protein